jgi:hypothetical protein
LLIALQPLAQQTHVASIRAPQNVEGVPDQRHHAEHAVERDVAEHAHDDVPRGAELIRIEAEAHGGAGDNKRGVKQGRKRVPRAR